MSPESQRPDDEPRLTGAYEEWTFGRGAPYANLDIPLSAARYVAAVLSLPPGADPGRLGEAGQSSFREERRPARVLLPVLWSGLSERSDETTHWPVILDFGEPDTRADLDDRSINRTLDALSQPVRRQMGGSGSPGEPAFHLNMPLWTNGVAASIADWQNPPPHTADLDVREKLRAGGRPVVMAVIDDGIPFAHRNFRKADDRGTRIEFCWLQSSDVAPDGTVLFGREFTRDTIDALVDEHGPDEDAVYTRAGAVETARRNTPTINHAASHGAHVLDAAAGRRAADDDDLDLMRIIAVQLPAAITADTTGYRKDAFILSALHYIFERTDRIAAAYLDDAAAALPLVINFSYGFTGGPHDGSDFLEIAVAQLIEAREAQGKPTTLVMPSGNSFGGRMLGLIPADALKTGMAFSIPWRLQPNDHTSSYLEIWLPASTANAAAFSLALAAPDGTSCDTAVPLAFSATPSASGESEIVLSQPLLLAGTPIGQGIVERYNARWCRVLVALAPTEPDDPALPAAPAGQWRVDLTRTGGGDLEAAVSCRIQRDNDPFGYARGGRQSYFDDEGDIRFTDDGAISRIDNPPSAFVRRLGTLNGLATHAKVTVVGGGYGDTGRATEYGAAGPPRAAGAAAGPGDVIFSAISDDSAVLKGVLAAGTRSGATARMSGTSMAAPIVARALAMQHISQGPLQLGGVPLRHPVSAAELAERPVRLG